MKYFAKHLDVLVESIICYVVFFFQSSLTITVHMLPLKQLLEHKLMGIISVL